MKEDKSTLVLSNPNSDTVNDPSVGEEVQRQSQEVVKRRSFLKGTSAKCITTLILVFIGLYFVSLASAQQLATSSIWQVQHPPFDKTIGLEISAISAQSDENVWAVGNGSAHWDGNSWTLVPIVRHDSLNLAGVAALSPSNVWGVGAFVPSGGRSVEAVEQFNGQAWQVIPDVNLIGQNLDGIVGSETLTSISALGPDDIWAAGSVGIEPPCDCIVPFIEHFDGTKWNLSGVLLNQNSPGNFQFLQGINAISDSDVWAVGFQSLNGALNGAAQIFHFDGTQWALAASPAGPTARFDAVTSIASNDVWAVGQNNQHTLISHFDGTRWRVVDSPNTNDLNNLLYGVTAVSSSSVWAVGQHFQGFGGRGKTLVLHFDGSTWALNAAPSQKGSDSTVLFSASSLPSGHVWLGGTFTILELPPLRPFVLFSKLGQ